MNTQDFTTTAAEIAREAGQLLEHYFDQRVAVEYKSEFDLVTAADRASEKLIVERLRSRFPSHSIVAEEGGGVAHDSGYVWYVDPVDGTTNFAHGFPVFAVSLALTRRGQLVAGVVYDPLRDELFAAEAGRGATLNGSPVKASTQTELSKSLLATGFPYDVRTNPHNNFAQFRQFQLRAQAVRRAGSAALDCAWMAAGRLDGYWEFRTNPWDVGAGALLVREAGGRVTTAEGDENFLGRDSIVASNGPIHAQMLRVLREGEGAPLPE
jgi:myo-inositol-1(or 4)-monophosphatase